MIGVALIAMLSAQQAEPPAWRRLNQIETGVYFLDLNSVVRRGNVVDVWARLELFRVEDRVKFMHLHFRINCTHRMSRLMRISNRDAENRELSSLYVDPFPSMLRPIRPPTTDLIYRSVCQ